MKWYFALGLVFIVSGTVMSTAAVPLTQPIDELAPTENTGVALAPADTPNGDRYTSFNSNGELVVSVDVISGTETTFDDVFVVGFGGVNSSSDAATIQIEHNNEWLDIYKISDTGARESVDEVNNTLTLNPGEQAILGFTVTADGNSSSSFSETLTYTMEIPEAESDTVEGGGGGGGGGGAIESGTDTAETTTPADEPTEIPTEGSIEAPTEATSDTSTDSQEEAVGGGAEPSPPASGGQQPAEPGGFVLDFEPVFGISWGSWASIAGLLAVVTNYLVQTRYHDVLPAFQTQPNDRRRRFRSIAAREAAVGLAGVVLAVLVASAASGAGFGPVTQLVSALICSTGVGTATGYQLVPRLDSVLELDDTGGRTDRE